MKFILVLIVLCLGCSHKALIDEPKECINDGTGLVCETYKEGFYCQGTYSQIRFDMNQFRKDKGNETECFDSTIAGW